MSSAARAHPAPSRCPRCTSSDRERVRVSFADEPIAVYALSCRHCGYAEHPTPRVIPDRVWDRLLAAEAARAPYHETPTPLGDPVACAKGHDRETSGELRTRSDGLQFWHCRTCAAEQAARHVELQRQARLRTRETALCKAGHPRSEHGILTSDGRGHDWWRCALCARQARDAREQRTEAS